MATERKASKSKKSAEPVTSAPDTPAASAGVQWRYAILTTPSAGGALVSRMLRETGAAGDPHAYFHPRALLAERARTGNKALTLVEFMHKMEKEHSTPNGAFGLRMYFSHLMRAYGYRGGQGGEAPFKAAGALLRRHDKLIWVRRRNKLHQAIAERLSRINRRRQGKAAAPKKLMIMPTAILSALRAVALEDRAWARMIRQNKLQVLEIWYEDLEKDFEAQSKRVLEYLGIAKDVEKLPASPFGGGNSLLRDQIAATMLDFIQGKESAAQADAA